MKKPIISIVTVVYNAEKLLEGTIKSVLEQDYPHIEYWIVDGESKDGTLALIKKYEDKISHWLSEPDKGLYDAMSKSLSLVSGDFILFINAGDELFAKNTISKMVAQYDEETDVLYGEVMIVNDEREHLGIRSELSTQKLPKNLHWKSLKKGMIVCHQGFMPRVKIAEKYLENNLSADIDWVIRCLQKSRKTVNCNLIVAEYLAGGISKQKHRQSLYDRFEILKQHYGLPTTIWNHIMIVFRAIIFKISRIGKRTY